MLVYMCLMAALLYLPIMIARHAVLWAAKNWTTVDHLVKVGVLKFELRVWYLVPQIQLPLEILLSHVTFLSM